MICIFLPSGDVSCNQYTNDDSMREFSFKAKICNSFFRPVVHAIDNSDSGTYVSIYFAYNAVRMGYADK